MANIQYTLFGKKFSESQGAMMTRVFEELLNRHPDKLAQVVEQFSCLSVVDLLENPEVLRTAPKAFLNKHRIMVRGTQVYIGTSYDLQRKLSLISRLFKLLDEDEQQFNLENNDNTFTNILQGVNRSRKASSAQITYSFFDKKYYSSQAEMMYRVFEEVLTKNTHLVDWAVEHLSCVSRVDYTSFTNHTDVPSAFQNCRIININGNAVCIGSSFNLKAKQTLIDKLLVKANLPKDVLVIENVPLHSKLTHWQAMAAKAVLSAVRKSYFGDKRIGIISQPTGTGKTLVLAETIRLLLKEHNQVQSVLLLTSRAYLAEQFEEQLSKLLDDFCVVKLANSLNKLVENVGKQNSVVVATTQKLLQRRTYNSGNLEDDIIVPFSNSNNLLVIVEEASFNYFSRTYYDMYARFPNAMFMGITNEPEPSSRLIKHFGPLIYSYTYEQAVHDGYLDAVKYENINLEFANSRSNIINSVGYLYERLQKFAEFIALKEKEQSRQALVLCENHEEAISLYNYLLTFLKKEKLKLGLAGFYGDAFKGKDELLIDAVWDRQSFNGILIACTSTLVNEIYDIIYLDKKLSKTEWLSVLSMLSRKSEKRRENGVLVDVYNNPNVIYRWLPNNFPLITEKSPASNNKLPLNECLEQLSNALKKRDYIRIREILAVVKEEYPEKHYSLSEQLEFLFPKNISEEQLDKYWQLHSEELGWKSDMWCALSADSACNWNMPDYSDEEDINFLQEEEKTTVTPLPATGTSQERGAFLERQTKQLIRELFDLSDDYMLDELRLQTSGTQYGFDIKFEYTDTFGVNCTCMIECKNYRDDIPHREVVDKLSELRTNNAEVDHWILISPYSSMSNKLSQQYEIWKKQDMWGSVRNVQIWTPDNMVEELFGLFPNIYTELYEVGDDNPIHWSEEKRQTILTRWRAKIAPVPHLPQSWKKYLKTPGCLLTQHEADLTTIREYASVYEYRATAHLLDENEIAIDGTAEEYFLKWLNQPNKPNALLLGDFGDGKSFFTYTLSRRLCEDFSYSPKAGWIPLRLSLRGVGNSSLNFRQFLEQRLKEFSSEISEWNEVSREYRFLIILDGFDEMSQGMNDTAVLDNVLRLETIIEQFKGHKILLTSRKNVVYSDRVRERIISLLEQPEIVHLAPLSRKDRLEFLDRMADTPERKERLYKIRNTHDLLGLAAKPLFLNMMRVQLDDNNIRVMDMSEIYKDYAIKVLKRKYNNEWEMEHDYTNREDICERLIRLLAKLAIRLQYTGKESISLSDFKAYVNQDNLAQLLWDSIDADNCDISEDADERVTNRSLLKYDNNNPENICFCHRSMKEYFIAVGVVHLLLEDEKEVSAFLKAGRLGYEILEFAGKAIKKLSKAKQDILVERLTALVFESRGKQVHPQKQQFSALSTNCVNLLHYSGTGLVGQNWNGLLLDNAILSGEDLSNKNFSFSSMRYVHLDNADLSGCDLRGCDFTGVQFEKSGQLISFAVDPQETAVLACYRDRKMRKWETRTGNTQTVAILPQENQVHLILSENHKEGVATSERFRFWQRKLDEIDFTGYVSLKQGTRILDFYDNAVLLGQNRELFLFNILDNTVVYQCEIIGQHKACLLTDKAIVLWSEENGLEIIDTANDEPNCKVIPFEQVVENLCAKSISEREGLIVLSSEGSKLNSFYITANEAQNGWSKTSDITSFDCEERILSLSLDDTGGIYAGTVSGAIKHYFFNNTKNIDERCYRLELKCYGAQIDGVYPEEQYKALQFAINNQ